MGMSYRGSEGTIFVTHAPESEGAPEELTISVFGSPALVAGVKELIQRGAQTWADAPAAVKGLADLVTSGQLMQDYENMTGEKK